MTCRMIFDPMPSEVWAGQTELGVQMFRTTTNHGALNDIHYDTG
jgi:hypothetical protein